MGYVNISEARASLSQLVDKAAAGEDVVITRYGKALVRITTLTPPKRRIRFGVLKGKLNIPADFDDPLPKAINKKSPAYYEVVWAVQLE